MLRGPRGQCWCSGKDLHIPANENLRDPDIQMKLTFDYFIVALDRSGGSYIRQ